MYLASWVAVGRQYRLQKNILQWEFGTPMGGLSYIEGGGGQISENLQSFVEISNTKEDRNPISVKGL